LRQVDELALEDGLFVGQSQDFAEILTGRCVVMDSEDDTGEFARTERRDNTTPGLDPMAQSHWEFIGKKPVERDGKRHVAITG
jgi:hypothetical protein